MWEGAFPGKPAPALRPLARVIAIHVLAERQDRINGFGESGRVVQAI